MKANNLQFDFTDKVVAVTGGSRGLGHAIALAFARCGAKVAVASRKVESCEETVREIRSLGSDGSAHKLHVATWADCDRFTDEAYDKWGNVDVLVNNAGMSPTAPSLVDVTEDLFDKVIGVNLKGPFRLSALFGARMVASGGGAIINISSTASLRPAAITAPYAAAKAGLNALTVAFSHEYGPTVRVNCVVPGPFNTDVSKGWSKSDAFLQHAKESFPLGRAGEPPEIVGAALYFASPLSSFTTGATLVVDGGSSFRKTTVISH